MMNIEVKDNHNRLLEKICKEIEVNQSQLVEYLLDLMQNVYSDEREKNAGVEKGSFKEVLTNLSFDLSRLRTIEDRLIESTNEVLGINEYVDASIYNIDPDLYGRSIFYTMGYEFCVDATDLDAYKGLLINVEMDQDYLKVSHVLYLHAVEGIEISDKKANGTSNLAQEFIREINRKEFSPFVNFDVEIFPIVDSISERPRTIGIKLIVKTDNATHMPSIETISHIIREVHSMMIEKLVTK
jgi:hypothetical protein